MKKVSLIICAIALVAAVGCKQKNHKMSHDELRAAIDSIEKPLMSAAQFQPIDTVKGRNLVDLYVEFADNYSDDTIAATYLHRAAQVCNGLDCIDEMVTYYDRVIDEYPEYRHLDECYYEKGIYLDNAGRKDAARDAYQQFLDNYPNHFLAEDIRKAIPLLDLSDELLIKHLQQQEKK